MCIYTVYIYIYIMYMCVRRYSIMYSLGGELDNSTRFSVDQRVQG